MTQAALQAEARAIGGSAGAFNEDLHAAFTALGIPQGQITERMNAQTGLTSGAFAKLLRDGLGALNLDFVAGPWDTRITFTRATTATYTNSAGLITSAAINTPRIDYDPVTLECKGLLIEEARTNRLRNNTMSGAVAGTPGTMPTYWTFAVNTTTGLTQSVVGTGTENGITYVDLKLIGTASGAGSLDVFFENANGVAALTGQVITGSLFWKLQAGSLTGLSNQHYYLYEYTAGIGFVTAQAGSIAAPTSAPLVMQRTSRTLTLSGGVTTAFARPLIKVDIANGAAIDVTLRIGLPQVELGAFVTSAIPTVASQVTRAADVAVMSGANFSSWYNQSEGTFVVEADIGTTTAGAYSITFQASDGANNNRLALAMAGTGLELFQYVAVGGAQQVANYVSDYVAGVAFKAALAFKASDFAVSKNGAAVVSSASGTMPTVDRLEIGHGTFAVDQLCGHIRRLSFYGSRLPSATLVALSA